MIGKRVKKTLKTVMAFFWWIAVLALVFLLVSVIGAKLKGEVPKVFGYSVLRIVSGSMEPEILTGEYIITKEIAPEDVKVGDVISFYSEERAIYGMPNTHRVEEIIYGENGIEFVTKGDANLTNDTVNAKGDKLIGFYIGKPRIISALVGALNGSGMFILLIGLQIATFTIITVSFVKKNSVKDDQKTND